MPYREEEQQSGETPVLLQPINIQKITNKINGQLPVLAYFSTILDIGHIQYIDVLVHTARPSTSSGVHNLSTSHAQYTVVAYGIWLVPCSLVRMP